MTTTKNSKNNNLKSSRHWTKCSIHVLSFDSHNSSKRYYSYCLFAAEKTEAQRSRISGSESHARKWWFWTQAMWFLLHCFPHPALLSLWTHCRLRQEHEARGGDSLAWVTWGVSMCPTELADGYDCELPQGNISFSVNLQARSGFQSLSLPWEMSYKKQQRKAWEKNTAY